MPWPAATQINQVQVTLTPVAGSNGNQWNIILQGEAILSTGQSVPLNHSSGAANATTINAIQAIVNAAIAAEGVAVIWP